MREYVAKSVTIQFPFDPYKCQEVFMEKVVLALQSSANALLESPTGTGKTLCLLCATLAWREAYLARRQLAQALSRGLMDNFNDDLRRSLDTSVSTSPEKEDYTRPPPTIYYASRTHSQLSQAVNQLKATAYSPKVCVLGSRDQLCINNTVQKLPHSAARNMVCRHLVKKKACQFHKNVNITKTDTKFEREIMDIEEVVSFGKDHGACPYYVTRENQNTADIIFVPYNYLIDASARKAQNIDVNNAIIIFDEAHNLEGCCCEATSFEMTSSEITGSLEEVQYCMTETLSPGNINSKDFELLRDVLAKLDCEIKNLDVHTRPDQSYPGEKIYEILDKAQINYNTFPGLKILMEEAANRVLLDRKRSRCMLDHLLSALKIVFGEAGSTEAEHCKQISKYYKLHVSLEKKEGGRLSLGNGRIVNFWCFSPGLAMRDLVSGKCRSVILASGTLAPLSSFATELEIDFNVRLEGAHVISADQAMVSIVCKGPSRISLNSSYNNRNDENYQADLGECIIDFSRTIPDGLIVFFPSYGVMTDCINIWKRKHSRGNRKSIWDSIIDIKQAIIEPKNKQEFVKAMAEFNMKVADNSNGSIFFAVCRGKVSEGLDFSDARGRAVIITGIPYPPFREPKVVLKRQYLDEVAKKQKTRAKALSGDEWYQQQAVRAVNQALGRVIRHKNDYGAILLCDNRFANSRNLSHLPVWVRPFVRVPKNYNEVNGQLASFFQKMTTCKRQVTSRAKVNQSQGVTLRNDVQKVQEILKQIEHNHTLDTVLTTITTIETDTTKKRRPSITESPSVMIHKVRDTNTDASKKAFPRRNALGMIVTKDK
ncbi:10742_t:CDS:10 [Paraglomus brasilianum]|uniref:Regulator of telomere elongation helicase 1 homolog n=1 Tax=Paraglomus brasilianum TaxID=144538 RepID=A0A9N9AC00_9GLOM|nr:10742_t:CDS:10 [Paraglomus brasilianum]